MLTCAAMSVDTAYLSRRILSIFITCLSLELLMLLGEALIYGCPNAPVTTFVACVMIALAHAVDTNVSSSEYTRLLDFGE